jgi:hypothetical protein
MGKSHISENFGSKLLQQDMSLYSERYKEHRMQLERHLTQAESRERLTKRVVVGAFLVAAAVFPIIASRVFGGPDPYDKDATVLSVGAGVIYVVAWAVFFIGTASYYSRFLPRVRRAREELRDESIRELRREVAELRQLVESKLKARETDEIGPE